MLINIKVSYKVERS